jgi:LPXTG-motif cell wall-anchored protein
VPGTGDITPVVVTSAFALIALVALAGYMLKRKFAL